MIFRARGKNVGAFGEMKCSSVIVLHFSCSVFLGACNDSGVNEFFILTSVKKFVRLKITELI